MHAAPTTATIDASAEPWRRRLAALCERHFWRVVLALLATAALIRLAILWEFWVENPFAAFPTLDSELYWKWAAAIAEGRWLADEPFHIAPLYAYFAGILRWCGGGLITLYGVQMVLHLATGAIVGGVTRNRFGSVAGCAAAALFLALAEPALFATRILGTTLQLLLVALLWWDWARLADAATPSLRQTFRVGTWIGLLALAYPAALLLVPVYAAWLIRFRHRPLAAGADLRAGLARAGAGAAGALLIISPATIHNALGSGEFIPISSHAGITLAAGNGPGSIGIFTPFEDIDGTVKDQAHESALAFERATGRRGSWREIDAYYRNRVIEWWSEHPLDGAALFARKAYWFLTSRHYDNVTGFALEREYGLQDTSVWVPVETPWIMGVALLGAVLAVPRARRYAPELALLLLPLVVCVLFMYSARYRVLAVPVLCGLFGFAVVHFRSGRWPRTAVAALALLPAPLLLANEATGFGHLGFMRGDFADLLVDTHLEAGRTRRGEGDLAAAESHFRRAAEADRDRTEAHRELAALHLASGALEEARAAALEALRRNAEDAEAHRLLYDAQVRSEDYRNAEVTLHSLEKLAPEDGGVQVALSWFYAGCPEASRRRGPWARYHARAAERLLGADGDGVLMARALAEAALGNFEAAVAAAERGVGLARERGEPDVRDDFESLLAHLREGRVIASRPRLLASGDR
jgi:tetratricopeptide (TPR) repeat protein